MLPPTIYLWQRAPALRLLVPFMAGIFVQWQLQLPLLVVWCGVGFFLAALIIFSLLPLSLQFKAAPLQGLLVTLLVACVAMCVVKERDVRNKPQWFGKTYTPNNALLLTLQEPLVEKPASYKALARVEKRAGHDSIEPSSGHVILYFKKDAVAGLGYGSQVWVFKKVEEVKNSGNPGGFDYRRYSLFQGITHQVYLTETDFVVLPTKKTRWLDALIFRLRHATVTILKKHIGAQESGLAEALLIGYKDDLDKTLVQSYSNTGVVHIIAISGLHVGLIYGLLLLLTKPLRGRKGRWMRFAIVLVALWGFGLLAGAQPSVMRSVIMFSFMAMGVVLERNASVYNNLALSALLLLCYNPFWLWDVGFQLSYTAVLSIIIFFKPIYNWIYFQNKLLDGVWKLTAVTLAAQLLTTPISLYYFHQFPVLFLFTNLIAVPLSSLILFGEILIATLFFIAPLAQGVGWATTIAIRFMNHYVKHMEAVPASVWQGIFISAGQAFLLLLFIATVSFWLLEKKRAGLWAGLASLLLFVTLRSFSFIHAARQQELIVYNIAKHQVIEIYSGRSSWFISDAALLQNDAAIKLNLQPSRIVHRVNKVSTFRTKAFRICGKTVLVLDTTIALPTLRQAQDTLFSKPHVDVLVLSKNPKLYLKDIMASFDIAQVVMAASVPPWKAKLWQQDCDALHVSCYDVAGKGAFVMPLPHPTFAAR